jgi:hypothetical protein
MVELTTGIDALTHLQLFADMSTEEQA